MHPAHSFSQPGDWPELLSEEDMEQEHAEPAYAGRKRRRTAAAEYIVERHGIPCSPKTLAKLACIGGGPAFYKAGRIPLYADPDLDAWAAAKLSKRVLSTSELVGA